MPWHQMISCGLLAVLLGLLQSGCERRTVLPKTPTETGGGDARRPQATEQVPPPGAAHEKHRNSASILAGLKSEDGRRRSEALRTLWTIKASDAEEFDHLRAALAPELVSLLRTSLKGKKKLKTYHLIVAIEDLQLREAVPVLLEHLDFEMEWPNDNPARGMTTVYPAAAAVARFGERYLPELLEFGLAEDDENAQVARETVAGILLYERKFKGALDWVRDQRANRGLNEAQQRRLSAIEEIIEKER